MRLALLIFLLFASTAAKADPVTAAVAWAATTFAVSTATVYLVAATVLLATGTAVYGSAQARRAERDAQSQRIAGMQDRMATRIAAEAPHRYIYGECEVGANIVAMFTTGDKDQYKHIVCVLAAHECQSVEEVYINNVAVGMSTRSAAGDATSGRWAPVPGAEVMQEEFTGSTFTLSKWPVGPVQVFTMQGIHMTQLTPVSVVGRVVTLSSSANVIVNYQYTAGRRFGETVDESVLVASNPYVRVQVHLGGPTDPADAYLMSVVPSKWTANSVLRGLCYLVVTLDLNNPEFQNGQVPIKALVRGRKLYDPRTGLTVWSRNPALAVRDYLTSPLCGVAASDLPDAQFITAANVCDEAVVYGEARYTINGTVTSDQDQAGVLESMAQCMAGGIVSTSWDVYAGKYIAPVAALTQDDIVGRIDVLPGASDASIYNGVKGQYLSDENDYVLTDFKPYQNAAYRAADERDLYTNIDFPFTNTLQRVTNLSRIFTEDMRNDFTLKAEFSLKAWPLKVGQRITFTSAFLGQTAKVYRITDKSYAPNSAVELTLKEDAESIWDFADAVTVDSTPNTDLPDPWAIAPLASLTVTSGVATLLRQADGSIVPRMLASWPAATTQAVFTSGQIEIEWRAISTAPWQKAIVSGSDTQAYLSPITPGYFYAIRARTVNPSLNVKSDWVMVTYQVGVFTADAIVYKWSSSKPATPSGSATYTWSGGAISAAPSGWATTAPAAPAGGDSTLWAASAPVSDISAAGTSPIDWALSDVAAIGYAPNVAGAGPAGYSNARVFAYQRSASAPTGTPGAVDYDFTTGTITTATLANGWQKTIPAANGNPLYVTAASASAAGTTDTIASGEWSGAVILAKDGTAGSNGSNGSNGAPGLNNATVTIYQRAATATAPALPSASTTYTFATGALTGLNNGWTQYIPSSGGAYLHTSLATAAATTATDSIAAGEWAAVTLMYDAAALIAAQAAADAANAKADAISADSVLDRSEKADLVLIWNGINGEVTDLETRANALAVDHSAYSAAFTAAAAYLGTISPAWYDTATNSNIVRDTYNTKFLNYNTAKTALITALAAKAAFAPSLVIGGRNLYKKATFIGTVGDGSTVGAKTASGFSLAGIGSNNGVVRMYDIITKNGFFTISFDLAVSFAAGNPLTLDFCDTGAWTISPTTAVQHFSRTFEITNYVAVTSAFIDFNGLSAQNYIFTNFSLVEGIKDAGWTPAPEDVAADTAAAALTAQWSNIAGQTNAPANNATSGAPAGTSVNGVPVETLTSQASAGQAAATTVTNNLTNSFTVSAGSDYSATNLTRGGIRNLTTRTASVSGGTAPYKYMWVEVTGGGILLANATSATVTLQGGGSDETKTGNVQLVVTDAYNRTAFDDLNANATFNA